MDQKDADVKVETTESAERLIGMMVEYRTEPRGYPYWNRAYPTKRKFKQSKRKAIRNILACLDQMRIGVVFIPNEARDAFDRMASDAAIIKKCLSTKEWGQ